MAYVFTLNLPFLTMSSDSRQASCSLRGSRFPLNTLSVSPDIVSPVYRLLRKPSNWSPG